MPGDALLQDYLSAKEPARADAALETLLFEHAEPLIRRIVWRRLGGSATLQDREDASGDALAELIARLQTIARGAAEPIQNFAAYAAVTAHHVCDHFLRRRFPARHRLKSRLRHALESSASFALWETGAGESVCGRATEREQTPKPLESGWFHSVAVAANSSDADMIAAVMAHTGPLLLDDLVEAAIHFRGIQERATIGLEGVEPDAGGPSPAYEESLDRRRLLERLWSEIRELPAPQRTALLLNLRDDSGGSALVALPASGIASMRQIAATLEMPDETLAALWGRLPLSDLEIAARLSLSRQQVINLRKSARQRLARRIGGNIYAISASNIKKGELA